MEFPKSLGFLEEQIIVALYTRGLITKNAVRSFVGLEFVPNGWSYANPVSARLTKAVAKLKLTISSARSTQKSSKPEEVYAQQLEKWQRNRRQAKKIIKRIVNSTERCSIILIK